MSDQTLPKIGFHTNRPFPNPLDALHEAAAVAYMLDNFIAGSDDLHLFCRANEGLYGLSVVLGGITDTIMDAVSAIGERSRDSGREADQLGTLIAELAEGADARDEPLGGKCMTARKAAIEAVHRQGFGVEDIAQAVNLKKAAVQRILDELDGKSLPETDSDPVARAPKRDGAEADDPDASDDGTADGEAPDRAAGAAS